MADLHIEEFFRDTAVILAQLYAAFPRKISVYVEDVAGADHPDEFGLHSKRHLACFGTMLWLAEEGWLRYDTTIGQLAIDQATLTRTAFIVLSGSEGYSRGTRPPPAILETNTTPRVDLIRAALKSGSSTRISQTVKNALFSD